MAPGELVLEEREEALGLRRSVHGPGGVHAAEPRIAAHLTQLHQRVEDRDRRAADPALADRRADVAMRRDPDALVELSLPPVELDRDAELGLLGQIAGNFRLHAAEQKWAHLALERRQAGLVPVLFDGLLVPAAKGELVAEEPRVEEVEDRPELAEVVLHRRARQAQPVGALQTARHLVRTTADVLDAVRLVEDHHVKARLDEGVFVADEDRVGGDDHVDVGHAPEGVSPVGAVNDGDREGRGEALDLATPGPDEARGRDDQGRRVHPPGGLLRQQMRDGL